MTQPLSFRKKLGLLALFGIFTAAVGCYGGFNGLEVLSLIGYPGSFLVLLPWSDIVGLKIDWGFYLQTFAVAAVVNIIFYALALCLWEILKKFSGKLFRKKLEPQT